MAKNQAAVALGKKRWAGTTKTERKAAMAELAGKIGKTAARRRAKKAAAARWKAAKTKKTD